MSHPGPVVSGGGTSVLGLYFSRESGLADALPEVLALTGIAVGIYLVIGLTALIAGFVARHSAKAADVRNV